MKKIIIADDHVIVRQGLRMLLSDVNGFSIEDEAETGKEFLKKVSENTYDLIILDIGLPDLDIFEIMFQLKSMSNNTPVLIFTMNPEKYYAKRLLRAGAMGYINKSKSQKEILEAIETVAFGELYISKELSRLFANDVISDSNKPLHETLTDREFQIMRELAFGKSLTEIADEFFISKATVSNHRTSILEKLNLKNNYELIQYAIKNGIL
jgi:two-component system invasion response regulator UvrY